PADDRQVGGRLLGARLLDEIADLVDAGAACIGDGPPGDDAVLVDAIARHAFDGDDRSTVPLEDLEELPHAGRVGEADDVVAQEDPERLVANERARAQDGVTEAEWLLLPDVAD